MAINLNTDRNPISVALQKAGYELVGGDPNLIQARLERGTQVVTLYIDGSGAVRAQITSGGDQNEQRQQAGNMTYTIVQQGQLTINLTTTLQDVNDITTLLPDIDRLAAGRPIVSGIAIASNPRPYPIAIAPSAQSTDNSGRISASDFISGNSADAAAPGDHNSGRVSASDFINEGGNNESQA